MEFPKKLGFCSVAELVGISMRPADPQKLSIREALKKKLVFLTNSPKLWWPLFLALKTRPFGPKVTFLFLNVPRGRRGSPV